jgi:hypothetical protein
VRSVRPPYPRPSGPQPRRPCAGRGCGGRDGRKGGRGWGKILASSASPSPTKSGRVSSISSHSSSLVVSIDFPSRQPGQSYRPLPLPHRLLASSIVCSMVARPCYPLPTTAASATDLVGVALLPNQACRSPVPITPEKQKHHNTWGHRDVAGSPRVAD